METNHDSMMVQSEFGCDPTIQSEPYAIIYTNFGI